MRSRVGVGARRERRALRRPALKPCPAGQTYFGTGLGCVDEKNDTNRYTVGRPRTLPTPVTLPTRCRCLPNPPPPTRTWYASRGSQVRYTGKVDPNLVRVPRLPGTRLANQVGDRRPQVGRSSVGRRTRIWYASRGSQVHGSPTRLVADDLTAPPFTLDGPVRRGRNSRRWTRLAQRPRPRDERRYLRGTPSAVPNAHLRTADACSSLLRRRAMQRPRSPRVARRGGRASTRSLEETPPPCRPPSTPKARRRTPRRIARTPEAPLSAFLDESLQSSAPPRA